MMLILSACQNVMRNAKKFKMFTKTWGLVHDNLSGIFNLCKPSKSVMPHTTNRYFISFSKTS